MATHAAVFTGEAEAQSAGRTGRRAWLFPCIVVGLLTLNVTIVLVTAVAARRSEMPGERDLRVLERQAKAGGIVREPTSLTNPAENQPTRGAARGARP